MKVSITFIPNGLKKNTKTAKTPLYMRVCFKRAKAENRLNIELSELDALKWDSIMMRLSERNSSVNHHLNRLEQKFQEFISTNATQMPKFNATYIKNYVLGYELSEQKKVMQFVDEYFVNAVVNNVSRAPGTIKNYRRSINHLRNYLVQKKQEREIVSGIIKISGYQALAKSISMNKKPNQTCR